MKQKIIKLATKPISVNYKFKTTAAIARELGISFYQCKKIIDDNFKEILKRKNDIKK